MVGGVSQRRLESSRRPKPPATRWTKYFPRYKQNMSSFIHISGSIWSIWSRGGLGRRLDSSLRCETPPNRFDQILPELRTKEVISREVFGQSGRGGFHNEGWSLAVVLNPPATRWTKYFPRYKQNMSSFIHISGSIWSIWSRGGLGRRLDSSLRCETPPNRFDQILPELRTKEVISREVFGQSGRGGFHNEGWSLAVVLNPPATRWTKYFPRYKQNMSSFIHISGSIWSIWSRGGLGRRLDSSLRCETPPNRFDQILPEL